jgi:methylated-DNA-[protein]-cysteine S-methyltransferase
MQEAVKYTIFNTKWGYFGLAGSESAICRTELPLTEREKTKSLLLKYIPQAQLDKSYFKNLQEKLIAYFEGDKVNFSQDIPVTFNGLCRFSCNVLTACRETGFGRTITYAELAKKLHRPKAYRAVGNALAKNPLPLIVPCHRVILSDGKLGGFSAPGGINLKKRLLLHEKNTL